MIHSGPAALVIGSLLLLLLASTSSAATPESASTPTSQISRYQQAIAADPGNLTLHYLLGIALLEAGAYQAALEALQTAYPAYRDSIEAHYNLGVAAVALGDLNSAQIYMEQAEALGAEDLPAIYPLADFYFNLALEARNAGHRDEAVRHFLKTLELDPGRMEVYRQLGDIYAQQGETEAALRAFNTYLEHFPDDPVSLEYAFSLEYNRAHDHLANNQFAAAEVGFQRALELQPETPAIYYYLGYIKYSQGDVVGAIPLLQDAYAMADAELREALRPLLYNCSLVLRKTGHHEVALQALETLAADTGAGFKEFYLAGTMALDRQDFRKAHAYLERAVSLQPDHAGALQNQIAAEQGAFSDWLRQGRKALEQADFNRAAEALQAALELRPQAPEAIALQNNLEDARMAAATSYFSATRQALAAGNYPEAERTVSRGLTIEPDNPAGLQLKDQIRAQYAIELNQRLAEADAMLAARKWQEAAKLYEEVLSFNPDNLNAQAGLANVRLELKAEVADWHKQGMAALDKGDLATAEDAFQRALALKPDHPVTLEGLETLRELRDIRLAELLHNGRQARERGQYADARRWLDQAQQLWDSDRVRKERALLDQAIVDRAESLAREAASADSANDYVQAEKLYKKALTVIPDHPTSLAGLQKLLKKKNVTIDRALENGQAALQTGDFAAAMAAFREVLELDPKNRQAMTGLQTARTESAATLTSLLNKATTALDNGELGIAEQQLVKALQIDAYHQEVQQIRERLEQLKTAGARPEDAQSLYLQGVAHYTQGRYPEAIQAWETVLAVNPRHNKARQNIEKTRRKLQQIKEYRGG